MKALFKSSEEMVIKYFDCLLNVGGNENLGGYYFPKNEISLDDMTTIIANEKRLKTGGKRKGNAWLYSDETVKQVCDFETFHKIRDLASKRLYKNYVLFLKKDVEQTLQKWTNLAETLGVQLVENKSPTDNQRTFDIILKNVMKRREWYLADLADRD